MRKILLTSAALVSALLFGTIAATTPCRRTTAATRPAAATACTRRMPINVCSKAGP